MFVCAKECKWACGGIATLCLQYNHKPFFHVMYLMACPGIYTPLIVILTLTVRSTQASSTSKII